MSDNYLTAGSRLLCRLLLALLLIGGGLQAAPLTPTGLVKPVHPAPLLKPMAIMYSVVASSPLPVLTFGARILFVDLDADGDQDLLYQNGNTSGAGISLKLNNGNGTFAAPIDANGSGTFTSGPLNGITFTQVTTATLSVDFDDDGDRDLIEPANNSAGRVVVNNGNGTFSVAASSPLPVLTFGARILFVDLDADGDQDLLYQNG
ncbi:FG-GAP repeat domain-containing protein, partial [Spirosoma arcticum]